MAAKRTRRTQQVAVGLNDSSLGERLTQDRGHQCLHLGTDTTTIKIYSHRKLGCQDGCASQFLDLRGRTHKSDKLFSDNLNDFLTRLMNGINTLSIEHHRLRGCSNDCPIGFSASTIGYK